METDKTAFVASRHPVDVAAHLSGGRNGLAHQLGVSPAALGNWKTRGVPIEQCPRIERATGGVVTRKDLRPDDWQDIWPELAQPTTTDAEPKARRTTDGPAPKNAVGC